MIKNNNNIKTSCCSGSNEQIQDKNPIDKTKHGDIEIKRAVRESYGNIAKNFNSNSGCGCGSDKLPNNLIVDVVVDLISYRIMRL